MCPLPIQCTDREHEFAAALALRCYLHRASCVAPVQRTISLTRPSSNALKLRKHLLKQLEKIKAASTAGLDISQLEAADGILEK